MAKVLCFGSLNIDYIYQVPHFVGAGDGQQPAQPQMPSKVEYMGLLVSFMVRSPLERMSWRQSTAEGTATTRK